MGAPNFMFSLYLIFELYTDWARGVATIGGRNHSEAPVGT